MRHSDTDYNAVLDVREIDGEPFGEIEAALDNLDDGETLLLRSSFEPVPLYDVLSERGFRYESGQVAAEEWHSEITTK